LALLAQIGHPQNKKTLLAGQSASGSLAIGLAFFAAMMPKKL
jgi:hypothetical protein